MSKFDPYINLAKTIDKVPSLNIQKTKTLVTKHSKQLCQN